mmetsp:Transcript_20208/g.40789  ORF Transcript_20208/g.40789 Transcript_20208/m.40789 type:complete len:271 (-) Transcript_20208:284-1096(-)
MLIEYTAPAARKVTATCLKMVYAQWCDVKLESAAPTTTVIINERATHPLKPSPHMAPRYQDPKGTEAPQPYPMAHMRTAFQGFPPSSSGSMPMSTRDQKSTRFVVKSPESFKSFRMASTVFAENLYFSYRATFKCSAARSGYLPWYLRIVFSSSSRPSFCNRMLIHSPIAMEKIPANADTIPAKRTRLCVALPTVNTKHKVVTNPSMNAKTNARNPPSPRSGFSLCHCDAMLDIDPCTPFALGCSCGVTPSLVVSDPLDSAPYFAGASPA